MAAEAGEIVLSMRDLREVTAFAAGCAELVLEIFEAGQPDDSRPRDAIAARAAELVAGDDRTVGAEHVERVVHRATPVVVDVLKRFPAAPGGGGRVGELIRMLDADLRH